MKYIATCVVSLSLAFTGSSSALTITDWYVSTTGSDSNPGTQAEPFLTIKHALSQSNDGDSINIKEGTYYERDLDTSNLIITINGTIDGSGNLATIIDGTPSGTALPAAIFWMDDYGTSASPETNLNNLVLTNGTGKYFPNQFQPADSYSMGGAVYVGSRSNLNMSNCLLVNNTANIGGALAFRGDETETYWGPATGTIVDTDFRNNSAELTSLTEPNDNAGSGGAVWSQLADPLFDRCYFENNVANATQDLSGPATGGGAMHLNNGLQRSTPLLNPEVTNCNFTGNTSDFVGGAIAIVAIDPIIDNCGITNNNATGDIEIMCAEFGSTGIAYHGGAGIYTRDSAASIQNCTIISNATPDGSGGGIYSSGTVSGYVPEIRNTNISNNYSGSNGGGIAVNSFPIPGDIYTANLHTMDVINCNVSSNVAFGNGGGIYFGRNSNASVGETLVGNNNTTIGNGAGVYMHESTVVTYDDVTIADNKQLSTSATGGGMFLIGGQWDGTDSCRRGAGGAIARITNSTFSNNNSNQSGGAVFMMGNANCTMTNTTIQGNTAVGEGGGFQLQYNGGDVNRNPILVLNDCDVVNNATTTPIDNPQGSGGGLFIDVHCSATINNGLISDNNCQVPTGTSPAVPGAWTCYGELIANSDSSNALKICGNSNNDDPNPGGVCTGPQCQYFVDSGAVFVLSPDTCLEFDCNDCVPIVYPEDIDGDGDVDIDDVRAVQAAAGICSHDNNGDGKTDIEDLLNLIEGWGTTCNP